MATTTAPIEHADVIRRHIKRTLPVKLGRDELTDIAIVAARKRRQLRELEADLGAEKKKRQQQIDELQREIDVHDRELDTEEQERVVTCNEVFRDGLVWTIRTDTNDEFESRPATAQEAQRYLPAMESALQVGPAAPLLDKAAAAQAREDAGSGDDSVPRDLESDEDDGLGESPPADETSAQRAARESEEARATRRSQGKKRRKQRG
jgi:hypothetical protein